MNCVFFVCFALLRFVLLCFAFDMCLPCLSRFVQSHVFFDEITWDRNNVPPFIPKLRGDDDTGYFTRNTNDPHNPPPQCIVQPRCQREQDLLNNSSAVFMGFDFKRFWVK
eukprot:m.119690 g.119690  ORF g.119690 m.119690 type:complete len:110 (-) comp12911_c1_seq2:973-1302(-)